MQTPNMDNGGRWNHIASEMEIRRGLRAVDYLVYEIPVIKVTLLRISNPIMMIIRAGPMGGNVRDIQGGWVYDNPFSMQLDWNEITAIGASDGNESA